MALTSDFFPSGLLCARIVIVLFCWQVQHRSDMGLHTMIWGSCCQRLQKGVSNGSHIGSTLSCCVVEIPDVLLGCGRWKEDDVVPLVSRNSSRKQNGVILCIVGDEGHHVLDICKTQSMTRLVMAVLPWYQTISLKAGLNGLELGLPNRVQEAEGLCADRMPNMLNVGERSAFLRSVFLRLCHVARMG